jgi:hypothetical protein
MPDLDLFQRALGLEEPWQVVDVKFDAAQRRLDLRIDFPKGSKFPCPILPIYQALCVQGRGARAHGLSADRALDEHLRSCQQNSVATTG